MYSRAVGAADDGAHAMGCGRGLLGMEA